MMRTIFIILSLFISLLLTSKVNAFYVLDTGNPTKSYGGFFLNIEGQEHALKFSLHDQFYIKTIEFYMRSNLTVNYSEDLDISISIFSDKDNKPHERLFVEDLIVSNGPYTWQGVEMNDYLGSGDYWVGTRMNSPLTGGRTYLSMRASAENPVEFGAYRRKEDPWNIIDNFYFDHMVRIEADHKTNVIPEPLTLVMFSIGILGLGLKKGIKS